MATEEESTIRIARDTAVESLVTALGWSLTLIVGAFSGSRIAACLLLVATAAITWWVHRTARVSRKAVIGFGVAVLLATAVFGGRHDAAGGKDSTPRDPAAAARMSAQALDAAIALGKDGHTTEAIEALHRLIAQEPSNAPAVANLCGFLLQAGRIAAAAVSCRDAATLAPANWLAHYNEACAFALSARPEAALASLTKALELVKDDPRAHLSRAKLAKMASEDAMLRTLHGTPRFVALVGVR
jgi:tetratricopeptide (TPR) repeat protein